MNNQTNSYEEEQIAELTAKKTFQIDEHFSVIGIGYGGTNVAEMICKTFGKKEMYTLNTSSQDIHTSEKKNINSSLDVKSIQLGEHGSGAGKDTEVGKNIFKDNILQLLQKKQSFIKNILTPFTKIVFICYSTGGGTGSGIGPFFADMIANKEMMKNTIFKYGKFDELQNYDYLTENDLKNAIIRDYFAKNDDEKYFNDKYIVIQIPILPSLKEGQLALTNTLNCLKNINEQKNKITTLIAENRNLSVHNLDFDYDRSLYNINTKIANVLYRYLQCIGFSDQSTLDLNDRLARLSEGGLQSLLTLEVITDKRVPSDKDHMNIGVFNITSNNENNEDMLILASTPFVLYNTKYKGMQMEISVDLIRYHQSLFNKMKLEFDDYKMGYYEKNVLNEPIDSSHMNIIHLIGSISGLLNTIRTYSNHLSALQENYNSSTDGANSIIHEQFMNKTDNSDDESITDNLEDYLKGL